MEASSSGRGSRGGVGRWLYRSLILTIAFICASVSMAILLGFVEGDPSPFILALLTAGIPTFVAFVLCMLKIISDTTELQILKLSLWTCLFADACNFAFSDTFGADDVWKNITLAPVAYSLWGSALNATDVRAAKRSKLEQCGSMLLVIGSVLIRRTWDPKVTNTLLTISLVYIACQVYYVVLNEFHAETYRLGDAMALERQLQDSLLAAAFDSTIHVQKVVVQQQKKAKSGGAKEEEEATLTITKASDAFTAFIGRNMTGSLLSDCVSYGVEELLEVLRASEESGWSICSPGRLQRALITCVTAEGLEIDCEVLVLPQCPHEGTNPGSLLCGLRRAGADLQAMIGQDLRKPHKALCSSGPLAKGRRGSFSSSTSSSTAASSAASSTVSSSESSSSGADATLPTHENLTKKERDDGDEDKRIVVESTKSKTAWQNMSAAVARRLLPQASDADKQEDDGADFQSVAWQSLCQVPSVCAFWCSRPDLVVRNATPTAVEMFGLLPGHNFSNLFQQNSHATLLKKSVQVMSEKLEAKQPAAKFKAGASLSLPLLTANYTLKELRVALVLFAGVPSRSLPPAVFLVVGAGTHCSYIDIHNKKDVFSAVGTVYPDESASNCPSYVG